MMSTVNDQAYEDYRRLWSLTERREILTRVPLHLDIELTNQCNLRCEMCWHFELLEDQKGFMDFALFKKIIDEGVCEGVKAIKLQSRGEAMLHPKINEAIVYAKQKGIIDIQLTTNATLLNEKTWKGFLEGGLNVLHLSLDPAHRRSYEKLNRGNTYRDKVIKNVVDFLNARNKSGSKIPYARIQMIQTEDIQEFKEMFIDEISQLVDEVTISPKFNLFNTLKMNSGNNEQEKRPCSYLWQRMVINFNGKATVCCRDYNCDHIMGDIKSQTLDEIWNGQKYFEARNLHLQGIRDKISVCSTCELY
jgi:radical SAM protein with 4Fe4S-binding SPASM domain